MGGITIEAAKHLGLPEGIPVAQGGADAFVGMGETFCRIGNMLFWDIWRMQEHPARCLLEYQQCTRRLRSIRCRTKPTEALNLFPTQLFGQSTAQEKRAVHWWDRIVHSCCRGDGD